MSLHRAMKAFVEMGCSRAIMDVPAWAETFKVGVEAIRRAWEDAMAEASMKPNNSYDVEGK